MQAFGEREEAVGMSVFDSVSPDGNETSFNSRERERERERVDREG